MPDITEVACYVASISRAEDPVTTPIFKFCLLYTSDAADERSSVDLGGRRIIKKKKKTKNRKKDRKKNKNKTTITSEHKRQVQ